MRILNRTVLLATILFVSSGASLWAQNTEVPQLAEMPPVPAAPSSDAAVAAPSIPQQPATTLEGMSSRTPAQQSLPPISALPPSGAEALHLPGEPAAQTPTETPQLAAPAMPPEPVAEAPKQETVASEAPKKVAKGKRHGKHHGKRTKLAHHKGNVKVAAAVPAGPITYRQPGAIYKKSYDKLNRHLPVAYSEDDYDRLVYTTIENDDINGLRCLLNTKGRDINMINAQGDTPLMAAVKENSVNAVRLLVKRNANRAIEDSNGWTPLQVAERMGNPIVISALVSE